MVVNRRFCIQNDFVSSIIKQLSNSYALMGCYVIGMRPKRSIESPSIVNASRRCLNVYNNPSNPVFSSKCRIWSNFNLSKFDMGYPVYYISFLVLMYGFYTQGCPVLKIFRSFNFNTNSSRNYSRFVNLINWHSST